MNLPTALIKLEIYEKHQKKEHTCKFKTDKITY